MTEESEIILAILGGCGSNHLNFVSPISKSIPNPVRIF